MLTIAGPVIVAEGDRDADVAAFGDLVQRCRNAAGCLDVAISADSLDPRRVDMLDRRESQEALEAGRAVANAPSRRDSKRRPHDEVQSRPRPKTPVVSVPSSGRASA